MRNATDALAWVLEEAIELSNARREDLAPAEATQEHADLSALCELLRERGSAPTADRLRDLLGEA